VNQQARQGDDDHVGSALAEMIDILQDHVDGGEDSVPSADLVRLLVLAVRMAGSRLAEGEPLAADSTAPPPNATDVVHVCNWLLDLADLAPFELGFWRNFAGSMRTPPRS
jgi:hypothetical protein